MDRWKTGYQSLDLDLCLIFTCDECPISEECDTYQQHRFEKREAIHKATMMEAMEA